jgi:hypothetical protein
MNAIQPEIQWFIARDGKQHGPISDVEMKKLVELGHLRPTDLVWRHGFPDWRPSTVVFPSQPATPSQPSPGPVYPAPQHTEPVVHPQVSQSQVQQSQVQSAQARPATVTQGDWQPSATQFGTKQPERQRHQSFDIAPAPRSAARALLVPLLLLGFLAASAMVAYEYKDELIALTQLKSNPADVSTEPSKSDEAPAAPAPPDAAQAEALPGLEGPSLILDEQIRSLRHWAVIRREFPEWYVERIKEAAKLTSENAKESEVGRYLAGEIVKLRRQSLNQALAAPNENLKAMAKAFLENLVALEKIGPQVCYAFIARGENTPMVADMLHAKDLGGPVKEQVAAVFEAIGQGRKAPVKHVAADKTDYDLLANQLTKSGWSTSQLQLFANPTALASSSPDKVCTMVQDWFRAHLALEDSQVQERLLFETLKPVVGG